MGHHGMGVRMERNDTGRVSYRGESTAADCTMDCRTADCAAHYVVRLDGMWVRAFHNESDAARFAADVQAYIDRPGAASDSILA